MGVQSNARAAYYCNQCGSAETETVKRRVGAAEKWTVILIPAFLILGAFLGFFIFIFGMALIDTIGLDGELSLVGLCASFMLTLPAGGAVLGTLLGKVFIQRRRRKRNLSQTTCRCKMCKHIFIPKIN
jgi:hypothetical protein